MSHAEFGKEPLKNVDVHKEQKQTDTDSDIYHC